MQSSSNNNSSSNLIELAKELELAINSGKPLPEETKTQIKQLLSKIINSL